MKLTPSSSSEAVARLDHQVARLARLIRALVAGGAATLVDLAVLALLVSIVGLSARVANVPALVAGGVVSFFANRHWVFRAAGGSLPVQAALYAVVELIALALNVSSTTPRCGCRWSRCMRRWRMRRCGS